MSDTPISESSPSSVNLTRSSHPWTEADSAAGFVLRYLTPMRRQLIEILRDEALADESLKRILAHLVAVGFGKDNQGRLRDFLLRGIRSAAKATVADLPEEKRPALDLTGITLESERWLTLWREGLIERAWRSLERVQHSQPDEPLFSLLRAATEAPEEDVSSWAVRVASATGETFAEDTLSRMLPLARTQFAQFIADEVAETLGNPTRDEIKREIRKLGLSKAFQGIQV